MPESASAEQRYFRAIEDEFIRLRGAPFLLSPGDWSLARSWYERGIPVAVVLRALEEVFARRAERREAGTGGGGKVQSLRYCASAIEEAWQAQRELGSAQVAASSPPMDVGARLTRLAEGLPVDLLGRAEWAAKIRAVGDDPRAAESALGELDRALLDAALGALEPPARAELEAAVDASVARLNPRLAAHVAAADRERLLRENARRRSGLPLLSLFSPDAR